MTIINRLTALTFELSADAAVCQGDDFITWAEDEGVHPTDEVIVTVHVSLAGDDTVYCEVCDDWTTAITVTTEEHMPFTMCFHHLPATTQDAIVRSIAADSFPITK